jgi:uncharacterized membrane protein YfcA
MGNKQKNGPSRLNRTRAAHGPRYYYTEFGKAISFRQAPKRIVMFRAASARGAVGFVIAVFLTGIIGGVFRVGGGEMVPAIAYSRLGDL